MSADISAQVDDLINDFRAYGEKVYTNVGKAVLKGCLTVERSWKENFRPSDSESIPDVAARVQTGRYRASITHRVMYDDGFVLGEIGTSIADYPVWLEWGTSNMSPHPTAGPAYDENAEEINEAIEKAEMEAEGAFHA
jgi:HK97 gp10 family phage protein